MESVQSQEIITKEIQTAVRHSAVYGLGNVLAKVVGFLMLPLYTHYLDPTDYGILEILDLSMSLFGMFLNMGMTAAVLRCYAGAGTVSAKQRTVSTAYLFVAATGAVAFLLGLALVRPVSLMLFGPTVPTKYLLISFASFILAFIGNLPATYLRALEASGTFVVANLTAAGLMLILNVYFIAFLQIGLMGILLSSFIVAVLQVVLLSAWTLHKVGIGFQKSLLWQMLAFGLPLIFSNLAVFTLNFSDRFFLKHLRSLEAVGIYAVGYKFGYMLNYLLVQPFFVMWQSRMFVIHSRPDHAKIFGQFFILYCLVLIYAGLGLAILSPEIVRIMVAPEFSSSKEVIPIVTLAYIFYGVGYYTQVGMFVRNKTHLIGVIGAGAAVLNLGLNYFLILHFGMLGAAWATLLSFLAMAAASYWLSNRVFPLPLAVGRAALAMAVAIGFYLISRWLSPASFGMALLLKAFLLAAFPLLLWKARILSPAEIGTIVSTRETAMASASRLVALISGKAASV